MEGPNFAAFLSRNFNPQQRPICLEKRTGSRKLEEDMQRGNVFGMGGIRTAKVWKAERAQAGGCRTNEGE